MGVIKDAIMQALKEQGVQAEWVGENPGGFNQQNRRNMPTSER